MQEDTENGFQSLGDLTDEPKIKDLMKDCQVACAQLIVNTAEAHLKSTGNRVNFVISTAINVLGNLTINGADKGDIKAIEDNAYLVMTTLDTWFVRVINHIKKMKESH